MTPLLNDTDGTDTTDEGVRLYEDASALAQSGELASARELFLRSIAMFEASVGSEHPDVANVLNDLGAVMLRQSEIETARGCFRRAWRIAHRLLLEIPLGEREDGNVDNEVARIAVQALSNLGNLEREAGNWNRAGRILKRAVRMARSKLGQDDLDTSIALNNLGMWCKFTGRFELGRKCYRRAMTIIRRHCGPQNSRCSPDIASIYHNLGGLEHTAGNFEAGEPFARKSVAIRRRAVGTAHPDYAADLGGLAAIIGDQGRSDEAESLYREALAIFERVYGDDHYEIAVLLHNLAAVEVSRERLDSAWDLYHRSAAMKERWLGADHPDLALTLHNLAVLAIDLNRLVEAKPLCEKALGIFKEHLVESHPTLIACHECAAFISGVD